MLTYTTTKTNPAMAGGRNGNTTMNETQTAPYPNISRVMPNLGAPSRAMPAATLLPPDARHRRTHTDDTMPAPARPGAGRRR